MATSDEEGNAAADTPRPPAGRGLRPAEQRIVATATAAGLLAMAAWFLWSGGGRGGLVPHDAPPRRTTGFRIDPNTASRAELMQLPGVGPRTADRILERRRAAGPFESIESLADVPGIGEVTLERLRPFLRMPAARPPVKPPEPAPEPPRDVRTRQPVHAGR